MVQDRFASASDTAVPPPVVAPPEAAQPPRRRPLGQILLDRGHVDPGALLKAVAIHQREDLPLGDILLAHGWIAEDALMAALAEQWQAEVPDLARHPPDARLIDRLGAAACLSRGLLPWRRLGGITVVVTARPTAFAAELPRLEAELGPCAMALASEPQLHAALLARRQTRLARQAERLVPAPLSCRGTDGGASSRRALAGLALLAAGIALAPRLAMQGLLAATLALLVALQLLKLAALVAQARRPVDARGQPPERPLPPLPGKLPMITILVPMFREKDIATRLVGRIGRLDYPRELLDVLLIVEEEDTMTRAALTGSRLPVWMRVITVPNGSIRTKPRAMNFALNFARGSIVGVFDAEDAPEPLQLRRVVRRFSEVAPEVVCLQGILDFYNPRTNWLSRCFTLEYASWFRVFLPGLARLGMVVPLGGTTLFFRRAALVALGGWDAHNVTEDADLGVRLARRGWRTELIDCVTLEEANCRILPWIKQRSRWQKGFVMTWRVHMRRPATLLREIGPRAFLGLQILLLGSVAQALLAPLLWSFWLMALMLPHPADALMPAPQLVTMVGLFLGAEAINIACAVWAVRGPAHRHLIPWAPALHVYNMLATFSAWKALHEVATRPFYWDKTEHGLFDAATETPPPVPPDAPDIPEPDTAATDPAHSAAEVAPAATEVRAREPLRHQA